MFSYILLSIEQDIKSNASNIDNIKILIPEEGPFQSILEVLFENTTSNSSNLSMRNVLVITNKQHGDIFASDNINLLLRAPPFNIMLAHWPRNGAVHLHNRFIDSLVKKGVVRSVKQQRNKVVYLWRDGVREIKDQESLGNLIILL